jgi:hypothetical protein
MGRGRQKAKQTRVARELKYHTSSMDVTALQRELSNGGSVLPPPPVVEVDDDEDDDPYAVYAAYADDEDDDEPGYASQRR